MLRSESVTMIREKALEGKSAYQIGKELGISKNTAKKYMDLGVSDKPQYPERGSKLDPYKPELDRLMEEGIFNCVVLLERIQEQGYTGKITIVRDYVQSRRPPKTVPAVRRYETKAGKQCQMDWGICSYMDPDGIEHKVPAFAMVLGYSRVRYVEFTKRCDIFSLQRCILNAFEYFGGVPEVVLTDNMKTVVVRREAGKPVWNAAFLDFCNDIGFVPKVCKVRRPETKGKVERLVRYVKDSFIPGRAFTDIDDLNEQARIWCDKANSKIHSTTGKIPLQELEKEKLHPLPSEMICDRYRYESRQVMRDGLISYDGVKYGVPWEYSGRTVTVRAMRGKLQVFDGIQLIAEHDLEPHSGRVLYLPGQYRGLAERKGIVYPTSAKLISRDAVEHRPLSVYEELLEVSNG